MVSSCWCGDYCPEREGSDPAAVIYDAVAAAKSRNADVLICDTAGRLHNKKNLMEELKKINRIIEKEVSGRIPGDSGGIRRYHGPERVVPGKAVYGSSRCNRYYPDKAGWNSEGWNPQ